MEEEKWHRVLHLDWGPWAKTFRFRCLSPCMACKGQNAVTARQVHRQHPEITTLHSRGIRIDSYLVSAAFSKSLPTDCPLALRSHPEGSINQSIKSREGNHWGQSKHPVLSPKQTLKSQRVFSLLPLAKHSLSLRRGLNGCNTVQRTSQVCKNF